MPMYVIQIYIILNHDIKQELFRTAASLTTAQILSDYPSHFLTSPSGCPLKMSLPWQFQLWLSGLSSPKLNTNQMS